MIKLLACIFMVVDHIGLIFFPKIIIFRLIGRLPMPLFAYCIAKGFYYSHKNGTISTYKKRMLIFALVSQLPYMFMVNDIIGNIGFLWLACLLFLEKAVKVDKSVMDYILLYLIVVVLAVMPVDYGLYGLGFTLLLYYFEIIMPNSNMLYMSYAVIHILWLAKNYNYGIMQLFTLPCLSLIAILKKYDNKIKIGRLFFYAFYPLHISVLLIIKVIIELF